MKSTKPHQSFLSSNPYGMAFFLFFMLVGQLTKAGNEDVATKVAIEDVTADIDLPITMRSGRPAAQVNNLALTGFDISTSEDGMLNLAFQAPGKGNMYVRIVGQDGMDVYFETVKGDAKSYKKQLKTASFRRGVYYFQVTRGTQTFNKKLIIS